MNVIFRRGSTASSNLYVGQDATISIDTDKNQIRVHDGVTPGGHPVANISDLADYVQQSLLGASNGVATLDANGKLDLSQIPQITITDVFDAESEEEMLDVDAQRGDVVIRYDLNRTFILKGDDPTDIDQWQVLPAPTDVVLSVNGQVGTVSLEAGHIPYSNTTSGLASDDVQEAIDELQSTKADKGTLGSMAGETASDYIKKNTPFPIIGGGGSLAHAAYTLTRPSDSADPYYIVVGKRGAGVGSTHVIGTFYMGRPWDSSNRPAGVMNVICHSTNTGSSFSVMLQGTFNVDGFDRVHLMHNGVNYLAIKFSQPQFLQFDRFVFNGIAGDDHLFILEESQVTDVTVIPENTSTGTQLGLKGLNIPSSAISGFGTAAGYNVSTPTARWNSVAVTGSDGETKVGKCIDFHAQENNDGDGYDWRVDITNPANGDLNFYNDEGTLNALLTPAGALRTLTEFTFVTDSDTGIGHPAADNVSLKTAGVDRLTVNSAGNVSIGVAPSTSRFIAFTATDQEVVNAENSMGGTITTPVMQANSTATTNSILFRARALGVNRLEIDGTGRVNGAAGSEARPSYSRMGDTDTGIYFPADDTVGVATSGVSRIVVNNSQITEQYLGVRGTGPRLYVRKNLGSTQDTPITGKRPYVLIAPKRVAGSVSANGFTGTIHILRGGPGALLIKNTVNVDVFVAYQTNRVGSPLLLDNSIPLAENDYFSIVEVTYNGETWYALDLGFYLQTDVSIDGVTYGVQTPFLAFADSTPGFSDENKVLVANPTRIQSASNNVVIEAADTGNVYIGTRTTPQALTVNGTTVTAGIPIAFTDGAGGTAANATRANLGVNVDPPATSTSPGSPGQFAYDSNYFYVCVANNTWRRVELSSW